MANAKAQIATSVTKALDTYFAQTKADLHNETTNELKQYVKSQSVKDLVSKSVKQLSDTLRQSRSAELEKLEKQIDAFSDRLQKHDTLLELHEERIKKHKITSSEQHNQILNRLKKIERTMELQAEIAEALKEQITEGITTINARLKDHREVSNAKAGQDIKKLEKDMRMEITRLETILAVQIHRIEDTRVDVKALHDSLWDAVQNKEDKCHARLSNAVSTASHDLLLLDEQSTTTDSTNASTSTIAFGMEEGEICEKHESLDEIASLSLDSNEEEPT